MVRDWTKDYFHEKYECYCDIGISNLYALFEK